ncbi:hypothetical protein OSB04_014051 [Centaurea solstitialis]|uniref:non-specific serine/threonine protein kinase n=1 Tax=Centaurea solstitialis TaxID=347529 RepID=A0AA38TXF3_9ASTR|nr:hypothetical protein OSB04_014051 [Centaurea solstitialis]
MVFHCRCFSFSFSFQEEDHGTAIRTRSTSAETSSSQRKSSSGETYHSVASHFVDTPKKVLLWVQLSTQLNKIVASLRGVKISTLRWENFAVARSPTGTIPNPPESDSQEKASVLSNSAKKRSNLRVFTFVELKAATKNFKDDSVVGYKGVIKSLENPFRDIRVTVKFARGVLMQASFNFSLSKSHPPPTPNPPPPAPHEYRHNRHPSNPNSSINDHYVTTVIITTTTPHKYPPTVSRPPCHHCCSHKPTTTTLLPISNHPTNQHVTTVVITTTTLSPNKDEDFNFFKEISFQFLLDKRVEPKEVWITEVNVLGMIDHPNLVKLIGYCIDDNEFGIQRLLVYEYISNKSIEYHLSTRSQTPPSWTMRLKVAQDVACGLAHLNDIRVISGDFKSSNILLDDQWNAKLTDFGVVGIDPDERLGHISTMAISCRDHGYAAPEYIKTGHLSSTSDVWSYGVFLYELITGRLPFDRNRPKNEQELLEWVNPYIGSERFELIIDPRLEGNYSLESVQKLSFIANKCLYMHPKSRPKMGEVLEMVSQLPLQATNPRKKALEDTKSKGKRGFADTQHRDMRRSGSELNSQNVSDLSTESMASTNFPSFSHRSSNLRVFSFSELKAATKNFSLSAKLGEGGFGCVYTGVIKNPRDPTKRINVAVKQLGRTGLQGHKEWVTEVNVLGVVEHPNLVKLVGYCAEDDERGIQRLLRGDHLSARSEAPLSWTMRLKVAQDAARGLAYLHEEMDFQIIFRDFKSSNILLDDQWNAKLSDFGLARLGPEEGLTHVSTAVVGTMGYAAPEYIQTGHLTSKSDVWSYGVFVYELITGRRPLDKNRPKNEQKLLEWVKPYLDSKRFRLIIDSRLEGKYPLKSAQKLSMIANRCLSRNPKSRPKMSEVLEMVNELVGGTSHTTSPAPPLRSLAPVVTIEPKNVFVGGTHAKKIPDNTKSKGESGPGTDAQRTEYACLSRQMTLLPLSTDVQKPEDVENAMRAEFYKLRS